MTTADAISGHGAHAADLGPITTSTPPIAAAQSSGIRATDTPDRRSRVARIRASLIVGVTTSVGPWAMAERRAGSTSLRGGNRSTPPPAASNSVVAGDDGDDGETTGAVRRAGGKDVIARDGDAATRNGRERRAAQRIDAHSASSNNSTSGPCPVIFEIGFSDFRSTAASSKSTMSLIHPPIRRPCNSTRTIVPIRTGPKRAGARRSSGMR